MTGNSREKDASAALPSAYHPRMNSVQKPYRKVVCQFLRLVKQFAEMERLLRLRHVTVVRRIHRWNRQVRVCQRRLHRAVIGRIHRLGEGWLRHRLMRMGNVSGRRVDGRRRRRDGRLRYGSGRRQRRELRRVDGRRRCGRVLDGGRIHLGRRRQHRLRRRL